MELQFPSFWVIFFTFLLFLYMVVVILVNPSSSTKLPPGPKKLPIIGNLHQLKGLPHHSLKTLAEKYGPVMYLKLGQLNTVVLSSPESAKQVLTTHDIIFANRPKTLASQILSYNFLDIGFAPYGSYWRQLRKICKLDLLSQSRVDSFRCNREEEVQNLVKEIYSSFQEKPMDLSKKLLAVTCSIALTAAFGKQCKYKEEYISTAYKIIKGNTGFTLVNLFPSFKVLEWALGARVKLEKLHRERDKVVHKILDEHKQRRRARKLLNNYDGDDFEDQTDVLLKLREDENLEFPLTDDAIKAILWDLVTAGAETSSATMEWDNDRNVKTSSINEKGTN